MARIQGTRARICTWELVTGFGQNPTEEDLMEYFRRDFPEVNRSPKFWKMISFNSSEGRRHRYLVILAEEELPVGRVLRGRRVLPYSLFLYACADEQMKSWERYENFRYAAIVDGILYVLVFYEGRLCHWSEERGFGGACIDSWAFERLRNMDEFLRHDPLFSDTGSFRYGELDRPAVNYEDLAGEWFLQFLKAARDPFWKGLHLEPRRLGNRFFLSIMLFFLLMLAGFFTGKFFDAGCGEIPSPEAPALTLPATEPISKEPRSRNFVNGRYLKTVKNDMDECPKPALEIRGIVGNRLFTGVFNGVSVMKKIGDTLDSYRISAVLRDRVVLECGGREWEVLNGAP